MSDVEELANESECEVVEASEIDESSDEEAPPPPKKSKQKRASLADFCMRAASYYTGKTKKAVRMWKSPKDLLRYLEEIAPDVREQNAKLEGNLEFGQTIFAEHPTQLKGGVLQCTNLAISPKDSWKKLLQRLNAQPYSTISFCRSALFEDLQAVADSYNAKYGEKESSGVLRNISKDLLEAGKPGMSSKPIRADSLSQSIIRNQDMNTSTSFMTAHTLDPHAGVQSLASAILSGVENQDEVEELYASRSMSSTLPGISTTTGENQIVYTGEAIPNCPLYAEVKIFPGGKAFSTDKSSLWKHALHVFKFYVRKGSPLEQPLFAIQKSVTSMARKEGWKKDIKRVYSSR